MSAALDLLGLLFLLAGALLGLTGAIGLLRFPDLLCRMHAASKPQVLGVLCVLVGVGLSLRAPLDLGMLVLVAAFQLLTLPVGTHMVGRAAERTGQVPDQVHRVDDVAQAGSAGDVLRPEDPGR